MSKRKPSAQTVQALAVFGEAVRRGRQERGMTLEDVSAQIGTSKSHLSEVEGGLKVPANDVATALAAICNVERPILLGLLGVEPAPTAALPMHPGPRIAALRAARGWTLVELAERSRVAKSSIARIETGDSYGRPGSVNKLAKAFGVSLESLYTSAERAPSEPTVAAALDPAWTVSPGPWGERHTHVELGLVVEVTRDSAGRVVHVYTRPLGTLSLEGAARATDELAKRVRSL